MAMPPTSSTVELISNVMRPAVIGRPSDFASVAFWPGWIALAMPARMVRP